MLCYLEAGKKVNHVTKLEICYLSIYLFLFLWYLTVNRKVFRKYRSGGQLYQRSGITWCGREFASRVSASAVDPVAFLRNLVTPIFEAHRNKSTSHLRSKSPLRTLVLYASTDADCALRSGLSVYSQHFKMAARGSTGTRGGNNRFAQFKLVLLGM